MENKTKKELIVLTELDDNVKQQLINVYKHPKVVGKTIAFPDCHLGKGIPIGCLAIMENAISPNMVGSDIGCGVLSCRLRIKKSFFTTDEWKEIASEIREKIPFGFKWQEKSQNHYLFNEIKGYVFKQKIDEVKLQLGTLGGGNHFIEFETDEHNFVWLTIHCGSRNIGKVINEHYDKLAQIHMKEIGKDVLIKQGLSYLETNDLEQYVWDMFDCIHFACCNRQVINRTILDIIGKRMQSKLDCIAYDGEYDQDISENLILIKNESIHNYIKKDGTLFIHRKGCIEMTKYQTWNKRWSLDRGEIVVGSQGTCSYIVEPTEFASEVVNTCSHGAGRVLGRGEAKRTLSLEKELEILEKQHIIHALRGKDQLDEATSAYKNIDKVIDQQKKYVKIIKKLKPFMVLKG